MAQDNPEPDRAAATPAASPVRISEDWLAVIVGLALFALALTGVIPPGLVP